MVPERVQQSGHVPLAGMNKCPSLSHVLPIQDLDFDLVLPDFSHSFLKVLKIILKSLEKPLAALHHLSYFLVGL